MQLYSINNSHAKDCRTRPVAEVNLEHSVNKQSICSFLLEQYIKSRCRVCQTQYEFCTAEEQSALSAPKYFVYQWILGSCNHWFPMICNSVFLQAFLSAPVDSWLTPLLPKHLLLVGFISDDVGKLTSHLSLLDLSLAYSVSLGQYETMLPNANFHTFNSMNFTFLDTLYLHPLPPPKGDKDKWYKDIPKHKWPNMSYFFSLITAIDSCSFPGFMAKGSLVRRKWMMNNG